THILRRTKSGVPGTVERARSGHIGGDRFITAGQQHAHGCQHCCCHEELSFRQSARQLAYHFDTLVPHCMVPLFHLRIHCPFTAGGVCAQTRPRPASWCTCGDV